MNQFFQGFTGGLIPALINGGMARYQNRGMLGKNAVIPEDMARSAATMGVDPQQMFQQAQKDARAGGFMSAFTGQNASQGMRGGFDQGMNRMAGNEKSRLALSNDYMGNADNINDMGNRYAMGDRRAPPPLFRPPGLGGGGGGGGGGGSPMFQPQGGGGGGGGSIPQQMSPQVPGLAGGFAPPPGMTPGAPPGGLNANQQALIQGMSAMQGPGANGMAAPTGTPPPPLAGGGLSSPQPSGMAPIDELVRRRQMAMGGGMRGFDSPTDNGAPSVGGASPDGAPELPIDPLDPMEKVFAEDPYARRAVATNPALFQKMVENRMEERYGASKRSMTMWEAIHKAQSRDPDVAAEGKAELDEFVKYTGLGERAKDMPPGVIARQEVARKTAPNYVDWQKESMEKADAISKMAFSMSEANEQMADLSLPDWQQEVGKMMNQLGLLPKDVGDKLSRSLAGNALSLSLLGEARKNGPSDATFSQRDAIDMQKQLAKLGDSPVTRQMIVSQLQRAALRSNTYSTLANTGPQAPEDWNVIRNKLRDLKYVHNTDDLQEITQLAEDGDWEGAMSMLKERAAPDKELFTGRKAGGGKATVAPPEAAATPQQPKIVVGAPTVAQEAAAETKAAGAQAAETTAADAEGLSTGDYRAKKLTDSERLLKEAKEGLGSGLQRMQDAAARRAADKKAAEQKAAEGAATQPGPNSGGALTPPGNAFDLFSRRMPGQPTPEDERLAMLMAFNRSYGMTPQMFALMQRGQRVG